MQTLKPSRILGIFLEAVGRALANGPFGPTKGTGSSGRRDEVAKWSAREREDNARSIVDKRQNCFYAMILGLDSRPGIAVLLNVALRRERKRRRDSREGERRGGNTRVHPLMGLVITRAKFYSCLLATARPYPTIICLRLRDEGGRAKKRTGRKSRESREIVFFFLSNSLIPEERKSTHLSPPRRFLLLSTFLAFYEPRPTGFFFTPPVLRPMLKDRIRVLVAR